jgi:aquaporin Z
MLPPRLFPVTALAPSASLTEALYAHWREYLMEGAEIAILMLSTCVCGTLVYSTDSPLNFLGLPHASRSILMGTAIAITTFLIIRSPFGRRTGAHLNPAVTLSFFWLGRVHRWDAACYVVAHFAGAVFGVLIARQVLGSRLSDPPVRYLVMLPGIYGSPVPFLCEFLLSVSLMGAVLYGSNHRLLYRFTPVFVALLTVSCFALSSSISGFSVNPARSFSLALFAWIWHGIWIYFLAPCVGMLTAAAIYIRTLGPNSVYCAKVFHDLRSTCPFPCHFERVYLRRSEVDQLRSS